MHVYLDAAHKLRQQLIQQGVKAYVEKAGDKLRVRAGPYATREAAEKIKRKLEEQGMHPVVNPAQ
jgi:cell division protein FtsN